MSSPPPREPVGANKGTEDTSIWKNKGAQSEEWCPNTVCFRLMQIYVATPTRTGLTAGKDQLIDDNKDGTVTNNKSFCSWIQIHHLL